MRIPIILCAVISFGLSTQHGFAQGLCNPAPDVQSPSSVVTKGSYEQQRAALEGAQAALDGSICLAASTTCGAVLIELRTLKDDLATLARHIGASGGYAAARSGFCIAAGAYSVGPRRSTAPPATGRFRTVCVRPIDGLFFPINFAATPAQLHEDEQACLSQCDGGHMYYYSSPDGRIDDAVDLDGQRYSDSQSAFAYLTAFYPAAGCRKGAPGTAAYAGPVAPVPGPERLQQPSPDFYAATDVRQVGPAYLYAD